MTHYFPPNDLSVSTKLHSATYQKTAIINIFKAKHILIMVDSHTAWIYDPLSTDTIFQIFQVILNTLIYVFILFGS
jgi:hypothetical protein